VDSRVTSEGGHGGVNCQAAGRAVYCYLLDAPTALPYVGQFWDNEEFESVQDQVDRGERVVQRMFREARVKQEAEWEAK
jgi:hypothetical protein